MTTYLLTNAAACGQDWNSQVTYDIKIRDMWLWPSAQGARSLRPRAVTGPVLAASSTSEMLCRSQWSRSAGLSECNHVAVAGWTT